MLVQLPCLVVLSLHDGRTSHCGLRCGNNDEVLPSNTQENLPSKRGSLERSRKCSQGTAAIAHMFVASLNQKVTKEDEVQGR